MPRKANPLRDHRRVAAGLDAAARRRDPARAVAQARASGPASAPSCSAIALVVMVPRIDSGKSSRAADDRARHAAPAALPTARGSSHEQRPQSGADAALKPAAGASAARAGRGARRADRARSQDCDHRRRAQRAPPPARCARSRARRRARSRRGPRPAARSASTTASRSRRTIKKTARDVAGHDRLPVPRGRQLRHVLLRLVQDRAVPGRAADPGPAHGRAASRRPARLPKTRYIAVAI